jgi:hypothetical protein
MTTIKILYDDEGKRRVIIYQRAKGTFGFEKEYFSDDEFEHCWMPCGGGFSFCDTFETALREARGRVNWLITPHVE